VTVAPRQPLGRLGGRACPANATFLAIPTFMQERPMVQQPDFDCSSLAELVLWEEGLDPWELWWHHTMGVWDAYPGCTSHTTPKGMPGFHVSRCAVGRERSVAVYERRGRTVICLPGKFAAYYGVSTADVSAPVTRNARGKEHAEKHQVCNAPPHEIAALRVQYRNTLFVCRGTLWDRGPRMRVTGGQLLRFLRGCIYFLEY